MRALGLPVIGKEAIPADGELDQEMVFRALEPYVLRKPPRRRRPVMPPAPIWPRHPSRRRACRCARRCCARAARTAPCSPRCAGTRLTPMGDIGCYTLGALPPLLALDSCLCMGASIGMMAGFNKALGEEGGGCGVIGDSTFFHSGITPLIDAVYNEVDGIVVVLDNRTTAMTGHQGHPGTGMHPDRAQGPTLDIQKLCEGIGVRCVTVDATDHKALDSGGQGGGQGLRPGRHRGAGSLRAHDARASRPGRGRRRALQPLWHLRRIGCPAIAPGDDCRLGARRRAPAVASAWRCASARRSALQPVGERS